LQQGTGAYYGTRDADIFWYDGWTQNAGAGAEMHVHTSTRPDYRERALVRFDLVGEVPEEAEIRDATLRLYAVGGVGEVTMSLYRVLRSWEEGQVTWAVRQGSETWRTPGCDAPGVDRERDPTAQRIVAGSLQWIEFDVTDLVQAWSSHSKDNHGVLVEATGMVSTQYRLASSEHWKPDWHPMLRVTYAAP